MTTGRIHIHLYDLKEKLKTKHPAHGDQSNYLRMIVRAYVEERYMILSQEVLDVIDEGDFEKAVELLLPGLQKLREERMQAGSKTTAKRKTSKAKKARRKAGVKSKEDRQAEELIKNLMGGFK